MHTFEGPEPLRTSPEQAEVLISVRGASKKFCRTLNRSLRYMALDALQDLVGRRKASSLRPDEFWALRDVSFELRRGQSLGVMGLNGAGKSTLLKLMLGSLRLTEGEIALSGCPSMLSEHGLGFDPLLTGRDFDDRDTATSVKVAIVNEAFVRKLLNGTKEPLGKRFRLHQPPGKPRPLYEIVGVVKDSKYQDMHEEFLPFMYFPATQEEEPGPYDQILIRSSLPLTSLMGSLKETVGNMNPGINLEFKVMQTRIHESLLQDQLMATLSGFFGFLAALLAAIGLYGVISYMVVQRTKEIGIRMAIGAERLDVLKLILREAGTLTVTGLLIGAALALGSAQAAKSLLYGLQPRDPLTLVAAVLVLSAVAAFSSFLPAYRASKLDPLIALRYE